MKYKRTKKANLLVPYDNPKSVGKRDQITRRKTTNIELAFLFILFIARLKIGEKIYVNKYDVMNHHKPVPKGKKIDVRFESVNSFFKTTKKVIPRIIENVSISSKSKSTLRI